MYMHVMFLIGDQTAGTIETKLNRWAHLEVFLIANSKSRSEKTPYAVNSPGPIAAGVRMEPVL